MYTKEKHCNHQILSNELVTTIKGKYAVKVTHLSKVPSPYWKTSPVERNKSESIFTHTKTEQRKSQIQTSYIVNILKNCVYF